MEEQDYIDLQTLLAKLTVVIAKKSSEENISLDFESDLEDLRLATEVIKQKAFFKLK